jgi:hypothetical protein
LNGAPRRGANALILNLRTRALRRRKCLSPHYNTASFQKLLITEHCTNVLSLSNAEARRKKCRAGSAGG